MMHQWNFFQDLRHPSYSRGKISSEKLFMTPKEGQKDVTKKLVPCFA